jgi:CysZ protein
MIEAAFRALLATFSLPLRRILLKAVGLAALLFVVIGAILQALISRIADLPQPFDTALAIATGLGIIAGAVFLMPPISSLIAGLFADQVADVVERSDFPAQAPGRPLPLAPSLLLSARFFGLVLAVNFVALLLVLLPVINVSVFFFANAYLLSREYFELAAMRYMPVEEARALRRRHAVVVFLAGFVIAGIVAIPVLNLITPVFGTAYMVHLVRRFSPQGELPAPEPRR